MVRQPARPALLRVAGVGIVSVIVLFYAEERSAWQRISGRPGKSGDRTGRIAGIVLGDSEPGARIARLHPGAGDTC